MVRRFAALVVTLALLSACGGGGGSSSTPSARASASPSAAPSVAPSTSASSSPNAATAFTCPTSDTVASAGRAIGSAAKRRTALKQRSAITAGTSAKLAIVYHPGAYRLPASGGVTPQEAALGATYLRQIPLTHTQKMIRIVSVPTATLTKAESVLRAQTGVESVGVTGARRYPSTVNGPYYTNDAYFQGFTAMQNAVYAPAPSTFEVPPYVESAAVPGQWDMHAMKLDYAFAYSQPANGSGIQNAGALGSANIKIAIIDTGEDPNHPELATKIVRQRCFITNPSNVQSTGGYSTDEVGHGTDVAGIAAEDTNNGVGYTAPGGATQIFAYRVFPTPDDNCANPDSTDAQCGSDTADIASAIEDAVSAGANVISMSLGGGSPDGLSQAGCTNGQDDDASEGAAVADAIAAHVIVVAASGNSGGVGINAPGCDTGVIAVGATSLDDGQPIATSGHFGGTSTVPVEYVTSYTQYATPASAYRSASAWGIVAPGGDAVSDTDADNLHWIQNIWTTTPYMSSASDDNFSSLCTANYPNYGTTVANLCWTQIDGTSMATPHVAGAAALILGATGGASSPYASASAMKTLLCETADDLGPTAGASEGCGRINVYRAMAVALGDGNPP